MLSPIQTLRHTLRRVEFEAADQGDENCSFQSQITLQHSKHDENWYVRLTVSFGAKDKEPVNYRGTVEFEGLFKVSAGYPDDQTENLVRMNGGAILYGAVREYVLGMTARSKHGPLELPTIHASMFLKKPKPEEKPVLGQGSVSGNEHS